MPLALGIHTSRKTLKETVEALELTAVQVFQGSPRTWVAPKTLTTEEKLFWEGFTLPTFVHSPYLFNPASSTAEVRLKTAKALTTHTAAAQAIGAAGFVVHGGQASGATVEEAVKRWKSTLAEATLGAPLLIENTAGGSAAPGRTLEGLKRLWDALAQYSPKLCLDTCHAWAGGLLDPTLPAEEAFPKLLEELKAAGIVIGLVHLNGSTDTRGGGRDHHSNLTESSFSLELTAEFFLQSGAPGILETPGPGETVAKELTLLRRYAKHAAGEEGSR